MFANAFVNAYVVVSNAYGEIDQGLKKKKKWMKWLKFKNNKLLPLFKLVWTKQCNLLPNMRNTIQFIQWCNQVCNYQVCSQYKYNRWCNSQCSNMGTHNQWWCNSQWVCNNLACNNQVCNSLVCYKRNRCKCIQILDNKNKWVNETKLALPLICNVDQ